jgi:hypothetical protein
MRVFAMKTKILLSAFFLLSVVQPAFSSHIIFYPPQHAVIYQTLDKSSGGKWKLPKGMMQQSLVILEPQNGVYIVEEAPSTAEEFWGKYQGKTVSYSSKNGTQKAKLLSPIQGQPVIQTDDLTLLNPQGELWVETGQEGLKSTLSFAEPVDLSVTVSMSVGVTSLPSEVVYYLDLDEIKGSFLRGVLSIENQSGQGFSKPKLEVRLGDSPFKSESKPRLMLAKTAAFAEGELKKSDESYRFLLSQTADIPTSGTVALPLFPNQPINPLKNYRFEPPAYVDLSRDYTTHASVSLELTNITAFPLASGSLKLFEDKVCVGDITLPALSVGEKVTLPYGKTFDVVCAKRLVRTEKHGPSTTEEYALILTNQKPTDITLDVVDSMRTDKWQVVESTHPAKRLGDYQLGFTIQIPAGAGVTVSYTISK